LASLRRDLELDYAAVWCDVDQINTGDNWKLEIDRGIFECDELILLVNDESLSRPIVLHEIATAQSLQKAVHPILTGRLTQPLPPNLQSISYLDLTNAGAEEQARLLRSFLEPDAAALQQLDKRSLPRVLKRNACRTIWPAFSREMVSQSGQSLVLQSAAVMGSMLANYPDKSLFHLNAGLLQCLAGTWTEGLQTLRLHAEAAGSFPGWYLYALHLNRRGTLSSLRPNVGEEALRALSNAERFGTNPLSTILRTTYEIGYRNAHPSLLPMYVDQIREALTGQADLQSEYLRLYWCIGSSFDCFRQYRNAMVEAIKVLGGVDE
jgi:hypothetical protein